MLKKIREMLDKSAELRKRKQLLKELSPMVGVLGTIAKRMSVLPWDNHPAALPPAKHFKNGTVVRFNDAGLDYFARKVRCRTKNAALLSLLTGPKGMGIVMESLPATHWSGWDGDESPGNGSADAADLLIAVPANPNSDEGVQSWESFMKYSGYLEEVPAGQVPERISMMVSTGKVPWFPAQKSFFPGDMVTMDDELRNSSMFTHLLWPSQESGAAKIIDVFPVQYISIGDGSLDSIYRPYDCIVSIVVPGQGASMMYNHYSGWLVPA